MDAMQILQHAVEKGASDVFVVAGLSITYKVSDNVLHLDEERLGPEQTEAFARAVYEIAEKRDIEPLLRTGDDDFSFSIPGVSRFRANAYKQRGTIAMVIRVIRFDLLSPDSLGISDTVLNLADLSKGLVLVTGSAGSGKSTTLAYMVDHINRTRTAHVITLEDPLEYLHRHRMSIVSQREIPTDSESYLKALRAALRQSPDVILLGEMRDHETINVAMTAAETGHLILSSLHTVGAANTIDRIIDAFPPTQQQQIRVQLAMVLQAVVSQQLIPTVGGGLVPAFEIMIVNSAIRTMIRDSKIHQIDTVIYSSAADGMCTMDSSLLALWKQGAISPKDAMLYSLNPETMSKRMENR